MKKFLLALAIIGLSSTFVGCGNNNTTTETSNNPTQNENKQNDNSNTQVTQTEAKEYKVGDSIAIDGEELTVTEVKRNYKTGKEYYKPDSGNEFVKINVTIKNNSGDAISVSPNEFKIIDSNGVYHDINYILSNPLASTELANGGNISGSITFEVPKDDTSLTLIYSPSYHSDNYVEVKL